MTNHSLSMRSRALIALVGTAFVIAAILFLGTLIAGIWVPDILRPPRWIQVESITLPNGQDVTLFQKRDGIFYSTFIVCKGATQPNQGFLVNVDDERLWAWTVQLDPNQTIATMALGPRGSRGVYHYDWSQGTLRSAKHAKIYISCPVEDLP